MDATTYRKTFTERGRERGGGGGGVEEGEKGRGGGGGEKGGEGERGGGEGERGGGEGDECHLSFNITMLGLATEFLNKETSMKTYGPTGPSGYHDIISDRHRDK